jgi:uncharacterized protein (TIGR03067 family)
MRLMLGLAACVLLVAAEDKDKGAKAGDPLTGTWKVVKLVADGQERDQAKGSTFVYKDGKMTRKGPRGEQTSTYKIDTTKKPATIDMTAESGQRAGVTSKGIFEVKGDELKICFGFMPDAERPKALASEAGSGEVLIVLKRDTGAKIDKTDKDANKRPD